MNALFDVVAPVTGCLIYVWYREWRDASRAGGQVGSRDPDNMPIPDDLPHAKPMSALR